MNFNNDNTTNDNRLNAKKARSPMHQIKRIIRPIFALLKKSPSNTYKKSPQPEYESEIDDNIANELLENEIFEEIDCCEETSAVSVYSNGHMDIVPVFQGQRYIPVHFARTEAGTFFWTSMVGPDCDINSQGDNNAITYYQRPELQVPACRWAQA
jgi:hypothetical protein